MTSRMFKEMNVRGLEFKGPFVTLYGPRGRGVC